MYSIKPVAYKEMTVGHVTASKLDLSTVGNVSRAVITFENADCRLRLDAVAPTVTVGHLVTAGNILELESAYEIANISFISISTDTDAKVQCTFYE